MGDSGDIVLNDLLDQIRRIIVPSKSTLEFECRYLIDDRKKDAIRSKRFSASDTIDIAKRIIAHHIKAQTRCEIEQSINFIKNDKFIKQLYFLNGEQKKDKHKHYHKEKLIDPIVVLGNDSSPAYRISLAFEHIIDEINIKECSAARIRLRFSIFINPWRLDITLIKNVASLSNPQDLKDNKQKMLFPIDVHTYIDKAPWNVADTIEFEMEYIGDLSTISTDDLKTVNTILDDFLRDETKEEMADRSLDQTSDRSHDQTSNQSSSQALYQKKLYSIAKLIKPRIAEKFKHKFGMKQLGNQAIEMNINIFLRDVYNHITDYYITDKVDGKRTILYIDNGDVYALTDTLKKLEPVKSLSTYVFDCEEYGDHYYIFDVMVWKGQPTIQSKFTERLVLFPEACSLLPDTLYEKPFVKLTDKYKTQIKALKSAKKEYDTDGFIFTPVGETYDNMVVYKYKPIEKLTIDFLIKPCPQQLLGIKPYLANGKKLYLLFCGISKNAFYKLRMKFINHYNIMFTDINTRNLPDYFPIQFEPSNNPFAYLYWSDDENLDGQVGEFRLVENNWELERIREDRKIEVQRGNYFGNNYKIAELTWLSYQTPLVIEEFDEKMAGYFQVNESELHKASRNFNSYVKTKIFEQFKGTDWVMDMASGKGQDLFRYAKCDMHNLLFLEIDNIALMELISRKHEFANSRDGAQMHIITQQMDLTANYKENIEKIGKLPVTVNGFDLIVCNFAFHYFLKTQANLVNVLRFISHYLKAGGRFIFTAFDGGDIVELLDGESEWNSSTPNKFSIKKAYKNDMLEPIGQKINVLLPFSNDTYYDEYLVNISHIELEAKKFNLSLEIDQSFSEFLDGYKGNMDNDDKTYTGLYHYYCFYKNKNQLRDKKNILEKEETD